MKTTLKLDLPTTDAIAADLEPLSCYPQLTEAEEQLVAAEVALDDARQALEDATTTADEMPGRVHSGKAQQSDLEQAITAVTAAERMLPFHEQDLSAAQEVLTESKRQARAATVEEARRRRDVLQSIADEISPVLEQLRELEFALLDAIRTHAPEPLGDPVESSKALKLAPPIDAVRWAVSVGASRCLGGVVGGEIEVRH